MKCAKYIFITANFTFNTIPDTWEQHGSPKVFLLDTVGQNHVAGGATTGGRWWQVYSICPLWRCRVSTSTTSSIKKKIIDKSVKTHTVPHITPYDYPQVNRILTLTGRVKSLGVPCDSGITSRVSCFQLLSSWYFMAHVLPFNKNKFM